ncbi:KAT8 regulatory NSL complex subunit 3 [Wyeomyia smithii]|uniref:KAT8 regulatory NSL complex subunit 3 n=1 Tax=Wyeomyia smithii TaxID=174621 RepID=UPI0024681118|nr:KAT8 regulatory NSL complex subunit 3 [Wyeomyia smithii]XP_055545675.1 KAT8 regulatory NSL complex subunit 3 [Wyeomyia smithii]
MEHSYSRDVRPMENSQTATTRTLMVHRPPQCPSCHTHSHDERIDLEESYNPPIPSYNEESAKIAMQESENVTKQIRNTNSEDVDWEEKISKIGWSVQQIRLFSKVSKLLDMDRLARLTIADKQHEPVHRRMVIDKSVGRLRQALAGVAWDPRLTQWLHGLLMESLSPSYLAAYVDILQTLKAKLPNLVDKMVFGRPLNINQELLGPVLKKPWEPVVAHKNRKLPGQPFIVVVPSGPNMTAPSTRLQKWFSLFATMASVIPITMPPQSALAKHTIQSVSEQMVAITRTKIQDVRQEAPNRPIILVGFNAGAALAIQIGLVETVSCIVCLGFAYNTVNGPRRGQDDHITDITAPVLFVIGQFSARTSQEEIEFLREKMVAQTSLVVVGSADDCLRVCKSKRKIEGVTQSMVDNMVMDEVAEFATNSLLDPPRPKQTIKDPNGQKSNLLLSNTSTNLAATGGPAIGALPPPAPAPLPQSVTSNAASNGPVGPGRKRKTSVSADHNEQFKIARNSKPAKKTAKTAKQLRAENLLLQQNQQAIDAAVQSILPDTEKKNFDTPVKKTVPSLTNYQISSNGGNTLDIRSTTSPQVVSGLASSPIVLPMIKRDTTVQTSSHPTQQISSPPAITSNIKVIPANQFIQLKPSGSTQKFFTIKSSPKPVVSVIPKQQGQTTTPSPVMKHTTPTSLISQPQSFSPTKFTIVRNAGGMSGTSTPIGYPMKSTKSPTTPDLSNTNIFDIPIVFADNDGNIQDGSSQHKSMEISRTPPNIVTISPALTSPSTLKPDPLNRIITLQPTIKPNKVVVINKNNIKQVPANVLSSVTSTKSSTATPTGVKYAKVVLSNPLTKATITPVSNTTGPKNLSQIMVGGKVEVLNNTLVKSATPPTSAAGAIQQPQKFQPIIINVDPNKTTTMKNFVRVGETQIRPIGTSLTTATSIGTSPATVTIRSSNSAATQLTPGVPGTNTILIKTNSLSQLATTTSRKPAILNRNITLRKITPIPQPSTSQGPVVTSIAITPTVVSQLQAQKPKPR